MRTLIRTAAAAAIAIAIALAALASGAPQGLQGQSSAPARPAAGAEERLRATLMDREEARVQVVISPLLVRSFVMLKPRLDHGLLVGEVQTGSMGGMEVFQSQAFPLDQVRELRVRDNRFTKGVVIGAIAGTVAAGALHVGCSRAERCVGPPIGYPAFWALSVGGASGVGGVVAFLTSGWKVVYSRAPGPQRIAND